MSNGYTVSDYLNKIKSENPDYSRFSNMKLYKLLKSQGDTNLPTWNALENIETKHQRKKKYYERKQDPDFVNQLFDWTDWWIDENSSKMFQSAYNNSLTGMAYQLYNGEQRFDLEGYNPGVVEDIISAVLSFSMPGDILAMGLGGIGGKALKWGAGTLAQDGLKKIAVNSLVKKGINKELAERYAEKVLIQPGGLHGLSSASASTRLWGKAAPRTAGAINSSVGIATFEGIRGGMQASIDGEDVWDGVRDGIMHGGILGGLTGFVGTSMAMKHAHILNKVLKSDKVMTAKDKATLQAKKIALGKPGQIAAEAGIFTGQDIHRYFTDEDFTGRDLLRSYATNVGMIGLLKAQHGLMGEGKKAIQESVRDWVFTEGRNYEANKAGMEEVKIKIQENESSSTTGKPNKEQKVQEDYVNDNIKKAKVRKEELDNIEKRFDEAMKDIETWNDFSKEAKGSKAEKIQNIMYALHAVYGAMHKNFKKHSTNIKIKQERKDHYEELIKRWEENIIEPLKDLQKVDKEIKFGRLSSGERVALKTQYNRLKQDAYKTDKRKRTADNPEGYVNKAAAESFKELEASLRKKSGTKEIDWDNELAGNVKSMLEGFETQYERKATLDTTTGVPLVPTTGKKEFLKDVKEATIETDSQTKLESYNIDKRIEANKKDLFDKGEKYAETHDKKDKLLKKEKDIVENKPEFESQDNKIKYEESVDVMKWLSTSYLLSEVGASPHAKLAHISEFAKWLAQKKKPKSLLDFTDKDLTDFGESTLSKQAYGNSMSSLAKGLVAFKNQYDRTVFTQWGSKSTYLTASRPGEKALSLFGAGKEKGTGEGIKLEGKDTVWKFSLNRIKMLVKAGAVGKRIIEKIVSKDLAKRLKNLSDKAIKDLPYVEVTNPGHETFSLKNTVKEAITYDSINRAFIKIFGEIGVKGKSDLRLFRNTLLGWISAKYNGKNKLSKEFKAIDKDVVEFIVSKLMVGHAVQLSDVYGKRYKTKDAQNKVVQTVIKELWNDVELGKKFKQGKDKAAYSMEQMKKGWDKIKSKIKKNEPIEYTDHNGNQKFIDAKNVETIFKYTVETGPRLNEIAPSQKNLKVKENAARTILKFKAEEAATGAKKTELQILTAEKMAEKKADIKDLKKQIAWSKKVYPNFVLRVKKSLGGPKGEIILGKITGKLIEIAEGKARKDTLPHEHAHDYVDVISKIGDPYSKKLIKDGIKQFGSYEKLVDAIGKYTTGRIEGKGKVTDFKFYGGKTRYAKMKNWVSRAIHHLQNFFGIRNKEDAARIRKEIAAISGEKLFKGEYAKDYMPIEVKTRHQTKPATKPIHDKLKSGIEKDAISYGLVKGSKEMIEIRKEAFGDNKVDSKGSYKLKDLTVKDIEAYQKALEDFVQNKINGQSSRAAVNNLKIKDLEARHNISEPVRTNFFDTMFKNTYENATKTQIDIYRGFIVRQPKMKATSETLGSEVVAVDSKNANFGSFPMIKRVAMRYGDVLREWGGKLGHKIAHTLDKHDYLRNMYQRYGDARIDVIESLLPKKVKNKYMDMIDAEVAKSNIQDVKVLLNDAKSKGDRWATDKWTKELAELERYDFEFRNNPNFKRARDIWDGISKHMWNSLVGEVKGHLKGVEFSQVEASLRKKFIQSYFPRRLTKKALKGLTPDNPAIKVLSEDIAKTLSKKDLVKIADELKLKGEKRKQLIENKIGEELKGHIANVIYDMITFGPNSVKSKPGFLKDRGILLPRYITVNTKNGKELVKTYESSVEGTMKHYTSGMGKYLATIRYFPEWTEMGGKYSLKSKARRNIIESWAGKEGNEFGVYVLEGVKEQLGLNYTQKELLSSKYHQFAGSITNVSAWMGLSSPMSGVKNTLIQMPRSAAVYGTRNTLKSMIIGWNVMRDPVLYRKAIEKGQVNFGLKQIMGEEISGPFYEKPMKWWFDKINLMTHTENFNRIVLAEASQMYFKTLVNKARGNTSVLYPNLQSKETMRMLKDTFKLTDEQINTLKTKDDLFTSREFQEMVDWVGYWGHKAGAGGTGVADLPLWFSARHAKPFVLFQKIATSVTIDSYKNYVKPMQNGNFAPIIKATIGHGLSGMVLYGLYDWLLGQQPPEEESPAMDRLVSYLWKGEAFGVLGETFSPYPQYGIQEYVPLMEPIVIRNAWQGAVEFMEVMQTGKSPQEALNDLLKQTLVVYGQGEKLINKHKHPYVSNRKRVKTLEKKWRERMGYPVTQHTQEIQSNRQYHYWKLKEAIMFGKSEREIARAYYAAFNAVTHEDEYRRYSKREREKRAKTYIKSVIKKMSPLSITAEKRGRDVSYRNEFLKSLSKENYELALKTEKEYEYKRRSFEKIIGKHKWKEQFSIYPY